MRDTLIAWVNEGLRAGDELPAAIAKAKARLMQGGLSSTFADHYFEPVVRSFWSNATSHELDVELEGRDPIRTRSTSHDSPHRAGPVRTIVPPAPRVHDLSLLQSDGLFAALIDVGGVWKPLGSLRKRDIATAAETYERRARANHRVTLFLNACGEHIRDGKTIAESINAVAVQDLQEQYAADLQELTSGQAACADQHEPAAEEVRWDEAD
jgi:hypothetical protein